MNPSAAALPLQPPHLHFRLPMAITLYAVPDANRSQASNLKKIPLPPPKFSTKRHFLSSTVLPRSFEEGILEKTRSWISHLKFNGSSTKLRVPSIFPRPLLVGVRSGDFKQHHTVIIILFFSSCFYWTQLKIYISRINIILASKPFCTLTMAIDFLLLLAQLLGRCYKTQGQTVATAACRND